MIARQLPTIPPVTGSGPRPRWSVMIPTYNADDLLGEALASVLAQDPGPADMQICVVDDASTVGDPAAVVSRVGGDRVGFVAQPRHVGAPANFTACVQRSRGRWVHLLHADDLVADGFYAAFGQRIDTHPCVMVAGPARVVDRMGDTIGVTRLLDAVDGRAVDARRQIARDHPLNFAATVVARSAYEHVGGFDPQLVHANDWDMWCRLASIGAVAVVDQPLAIYRRHDDSDTEHLRTSMVWLTDTLRAVELIADGSPDEVSGREVRRHTHRWLSVEAQRMAERCEQRGQRRLAVRNALWAVRLDRSHLGWAVRLIRRTLRAPGPTG